MREVISRRSVKINIPQFVEEYYSAYKSKDFEDCEELKEYFYKVYERSTLGVKLSMEAFISRYLPKNKIDDVKDLGGLFKPLNLKLN